MENRVECYDHLGNRYKSINEMARRYAINKWTLKSRLDSGWGLERALTTPTAEYKESIMVKDHLGIAYPNFTVMAESYGLSRNALNCRSRSGWDLERALTTPVFERHRACKDHLGNNYDTVTDMCKEYGVSMYAYIYRIKHGWSLQDALTIPVEQMDYCEDDMGNKFDNEIDMCNYHGIKFSAFRYRISKGWTRKEALLIPTSLNIRRAYIGIDEKQYYRINSNGNIHYLDCEQIVEHHKGLQVRCKIHECKY